MLVDMEREMSFSVQSVNPNPERMLSKFNTTWQKFCLLTKGGNIVHRKNAGDSGSKQRSTGTSFSRYY